MKIFYFSLIVAISNGCLFASDNDPINGNNNTNNGTTVATNNMSTATNNTTTSTNNATTSPNNGVTTTNTTPTTTQSLCGNQTLDESESCDGELLNEKTCTTETGEPSVGELSCSDNCEVITRDCSPQLKFAAGWYHTCVLTPDGKPDCWGSKPNDLDLDTVNRGQIPPVDDTRAYEKIEASRSHTCGITELGEIDCWGWNGRNLIDDIPVGNDFIDVSMGGLHACALKGSVIKCWGAKDNNQGDVPIVGFKQLSAGLLHTCAIDEFDALVCWGIKEGAQFTGQLDSPPGKFIYVEAGDSYSCALREGTNQAECWGAATGNRLSAPTTEFVQLSVGKSHACGRTNLGEVECWGVNNDDQLNVPLPNNYLSISAGGFHTCGLTPDNKLQCWGRNLNGQLYKTDP